jgi:hypothetical protein
MLVRASSDGDRRRVARSPDGGTSGGVESLQHFVLALAREHVEAITNQDRCGVALADVDLPPQGEPIGPGLRRRKRRGDAVPVGTAELRPVLQPWLASGVVNPRTSAKPTKPPWT